MQLEVVAPGDAACATREQMMDSVAARAGENELNRGEPLRVRVLFDAREARPGWRARISSLNAHGQVLGVRELTTDREDCRALDAALVLVLCSVLGVGSDAQSALPKEPEPEPPRVPEPEPVADRVPSQPAPSSAPPRFTHSFEGQPSPPWTLDVGLGGRVLTGLMPGTSPGIAVNVRAHSGDLQLIVGAVMIPSALAQVGPHGQTQFSAGLGELGACVIAARPAAALLALCAAAQAGVLWGSTRGLFINRVSQEAVLQAVPSARLRLPLGSTFSLQAAAGASLPLRSIAYSYRSEDGASREFHSIDVGLWGELALGLRLF